jgi:hypothetical protein
VTFLNLDPTASTLLISLGYAIAVVSTLLALFIQKLMLLYEGADLDSRFNIVRPKDAKKSNARKTEAGALQMNIRIKME